MVGITYRKLADGVYIVNNDSGCRSAAAEHYGRDLPSGEGPWGLGGTPLQYPSVLRFMGAPGTTDHPRCWWEPKDSYIRNLKEKLDIIEGF